MSGYLFLYTTFPDIETAKGAARALVEARAVACANILGGVHAIYRYDGTVDEASEVAAIFKLPAARQDEAAALLRQNHPYETPVAVFLKVWPDAATARWLDQETGADGAA